MMGSLGTHVNRRAEQSEMEVIQKCIESLMCHFLYSQHSQRHTDWRHRLDKCFSSKVSKEDFGLLLTDLEYTASPLQYPRTEAEDG